MKKACKICKAIFEGDTCPICGNKEATSEWKGKIIIFEPEQSEVAKKLNINKKGMYAIKVK